VCRGLRIEPPTVSGGGYGLAPMVQLRAGDARAMRGQT
jgi:hypothetical protein